MKKNILFLSLLCVIAIAILSKSSAVNTSSCPHVNIEKDIVVLSAAKQLSGRISSNRGNSVERDVVPHKELAVKMALLLLESSYGKEIYDEKPYRVALLDSVWVVETSLTPPSIDKDNSQVDSETKMEAIICGGIGHVEINKHTGEVYSIYHTK